MGLDYDGCCKAIDAMDVLLSELQCTAGTITTLFRDAQESLSDTEELEYAKKVHDVMYSIFEAAFQLARDVRKATAYPPPSLVQQIDSDTEDSDIEDRE